MKSTRMWPGGLVCRNLLRVVFMGYLVVGLMTSTLPQRAFGRSLRKRKPQKKRRSLNCQSTNGIQEPMHYRSKVPSEQTSVVMKNLSTEESLNQGIEVEK